MAAEVMMRAAAVAMVSKSQSSDAARATSAALHSLAVAEHHKCCGK
jgi:NADH:ubiquinone oxidoreductase subunit K